MKYAIHISTILFLLCVTSAWADNIPVGVTIFVSGQASATSPDQSTRTLKRSAKIYNGDTLTTHKGSILQIRFIDGAIVALREDSILKIGDYEYKSPTKKENSALSLLKGGFRTISGKIGKQNYKVSTNMATIGIRGTHYEAILNDGKLYVGVWRGGVKVTNDGGQINLGLGAAYNFAKVTNFQTSPMGLAKPPAIFLTPTIANSNHTPPDKTVQKPHPVAESRNSIPALLGPTPLTTAEAVKARRNLTNITLNRLGVLTYSGADVANFYGGTSGYDSNGNPVITDNGLGPNDAGFYSTPPKVAYWQGTANPIGKGSVDYTNGYIVNWGIWDTSSGGSSIRQSDPTGYTFEANVNRNLYWLTMLPTPASTLNALSGTATYSTSASKGYVIGGSSNGAINRSNFTFTANTNFSTGVVSGSLTIANIDNWNVIFNGDPNNATNGKGLVNGVLDVTPDKAASTVQSVYGVKSKFGIVVTGGSAQAVAGAFDLEAYNKSTNASIPGVHAEGVFVAEQ